MKEQTANGIATAIIILVLAIGVYFLGQISAYESTAPLSNFVTFETQQIQSDQDQTQVLGSVQNQLNTDTNVIGGLLQHFNLKYNAPTTTK